MPGDWDRIPEPIGVLFGAQLGWSPKRESQSMDSSCKSCGGRIAKGSRLYCAGCTRTGFEDRVQSGRLRARLEAARKKARPVAKFRPRARLSARDCRAIARTPEGRDWLRAMGRLEAVEQAEQAEQAQESS